MRISDWSSDVCSSDLCVVFNLHVRHDAAGLAAAADSFRALIDLALARGGSYYLTYHRWAARGQVEAAHPRFAEFLRAQRELDPAGRWRGDWYGHHCRLLDPGPEGGGRHGKPQMGRAGCGGRGCEFR